MIHEEHHFKIGDYASCYVTKRHGALWLCGVQVAKEHRGKGLMHKLLDAVIRKYGWHDIYLLAWSYNDMPCEDDALVNLYFSYGWQYAGVKEVDLVDGFARYDPLPGLLVRHADTAELS